MIRSALKFLYGSTPAEFKSEFDLSESVERLRAATKRSALGVLAQQAAAGRVSESRVRLQRVIPMFGNSFKPFFIGRFEQRGGSVFLAGRFTMLFLAKAFMTVWFGLLLIFALMSVTLAPAKQGNTVAMLLGALGMFGAGIALVAVGKWFARNDVVWLSKLFQTTLSPGTRNDTSIAISQGVSLAPGSSSAPTSFSRYAALVLLLMGLMNLWFAGPGNAFYRGMSRAGTGGREVSGTLRIEAAAIGVWAIALAYGVYRRKIWAWRLGLVFIAAAWLMGVLQPFPSAQFGANPLPRIAFTIGSIAVMAYWGWWWYAQRIHFVRGNEPPN